MRANAHAGGTPEAARLTDRDFEIVDDIGPTLRDMGIVFAGIDITAGTSPKLRPHRHIRETKTVTRYCRNDLDAQRRASRPGFVSDSFLARQRVHRNGAGNAVFAVDDAGMGKVIELRDRYLPGRDSVPAVFSAMSCLKIRFRPPAALRNNRRLRHSLLSCQT